MTDRPQEQLQRSKDLAQLVALPQEIIAKIYRHIFVDVLITIHIRDGENVLKFDLPWQFEQLLVCSDIYLKARQTFYDQAFFVYSRWCHPNNQDLLARWSQSARSCVKRLVHVRTTEIEHLEMLLEHFPNLQTIGIWNQKPLSHHSWVSMKRLGAENVKNLLALEFPLHWAILKTLRAVRRTMIVLMAYNWQDSGSNYHFLLRYPRAYGAEVDVFQSSSNARTHRSRLPLQRFPSKHLWAEIFHHEPAIEAPSYSAGDWRGMDSLIMREPGGHEQAKFLRALSIQAGSILP